MVEIRVAVADAAGAHGLLRRLTGLFGRSSVTFDGTRNEVRVRGRGVCARARDRSELGAVPAPRESDERARTPRADPVRRGPDGREGFRPIDLWESEQAWETFRGSRLEQEVAELSGTPRPRSTSRDLRPANIVVGADLGVVASAPSQPRREEQ
jgi:hypothetical protein